MFAKAAFALASVGLALLAVVFAVIVVYVARTEVWPALEAGSLNVTTNTMILNVVWKGNAIYLLLAAYVTAVAGFAFAAWRCARRVFKH